MQNIQLLSLMRWKMPEVGPTPGQVQTLRDECGANPEEFRDMPRDDITAFIKRRKQTSGGGNPKAMSETLLRKRMGEIQKKRLQVGMPVDALNNDGVRVVQNRRIVRITDDGFVHLEGLKTRYSPQRIEPTSTR
jgi:hypothetical protein